MALSCLAYASRLTTCWMIAMMGSMKMSMRPKMAHAMRLRRLRSQPRHATLPQMISDGSGAPFAFHRSSR